MRSIIRIFIISLLLTLFVFTCANAAVNSDDNLQLPASSQTVWSMNQPADEATEKQQTASTLPAALQIIDESAFEGTALTSVKLPESVEYIGDKAFAHIQSLRSIHIPDSTKFIGKDAFTGSGQVSIMAYANSYARTWARNNGIPFAPIAAITASSGTPQITGLSPGRTIREQLTSDETIQAPQYSEQNGRTEGEIKAAKHEACFAFSVQGRSPPMA